MPTFTSPAALTRHQLARFKRVGLAMETAHAEIVSGAIRDHATLTSGRVSTKQLRQMGHPFGRGVSGQRSTGVRGVVNKKAPGLTSRQKARNRLKHGVLDPLPINRQTGKLRGSFRQKTTSRNGRTDSFWFDAAYAPFILSPVGTRRMTARGLYSVGGRPGELAVRHRARKQAYVIALRGAQHNH